MNTRSLILLFIAGIGLYSCEKEENCYDVYEGSFIYTQKSVQCVPYWAKTVAVYKDSLSNEIELTIQKHPDDKFKWHFPGRCPKNNKDTIFHIFEAARKQVTLGNDSIKYYLGVSITTMLDWVYFKKYDELFIQNNLSDSGELQNLTMAVDARDVPEQQIKNKYEKAIAFEPEIEIFGETYHNVYHVKFMDMNWPNKLYYSFERGVVSFKDNTGKRWVLVRLY